MAHIGQSRPDYGLDFHVKVLITFYGVPSALGSGRDVGTFVSTKRGEKLYLYQHGSIEREKERIPTERENGTSPFAALR